MVARAGSASEDLNGLEAAQGTSVEADQGIAVVELFTSEGCSSCPRADELLSAIVRDARQRMRPVYALAFHVDYWDPQGWPDRFATAAHTARQREYVRALGARSLYTPQMVVNGVAEFVGSVRLRARWEIRAALKRPAPARFRALAAEVDGGRDGSVVVTYQIDPPPAEAVLNIAVVERDLVTEVLRGENAGRTLHHDNVVRAFTSLPLEAGSGRVVLEAPPGVVFANSSVIACVQDSTTMRMVGALAIDLTPTGGPPTEREVSRTRPGESRPPPPDG